MNRHDWKLFAIYVVIALCVCVLSLIALLFGPPRP